MGGVLCGMKSATTTDTTLLPHPHPSSSPYSICLYLTPCKIKSALFHRESHPNLAYFSL